MWLTSYIVNVLMSEYQAAGMLDSPNGDHRGRYGVITMDAVIRTSPNAPQNVINRTVA